MMKVTTSRGHPTTIHCQGVLRETSLGRHSLLGFLFLAHAANDQDHDVGDSVAYISFGFPVSQLSTMVLAVGQGTCLGEWDLENLSNVVEQLRARVSAHHTAPIVG